MKMAERVTLVAILIILIGGSVWLYFTYQYEQKELHDAVARGDYEIRDLSDSADINDWKKYYPELIPVTIGAVQVQASVADSLPERIKGLSGTPYLPTGVVKLFAFGAEGEHAIWMKDMKYSIDIIWVAKKGTIVHIEENVSPDTYANKKSFSSPKPAWYVIETNAGFVASSSISVGDEVVVPDLQKN